jgi:hypothetical protein
MNVFRGVVDIDLFRFCDDSISGSKMLSPGAGSCGRASQAEPV